MDEITLTKSYIYYRIYRVMGSCTNRFQYITAIKYLNRLVDKFYSQREYNDFDKIDISNYYINEKHRASVELSVEDKSYLRNT